MREDRRRLQARWWEILIPVFVLLVGVTALSRTPLDRAVYALLGVLFVAVISWFSIILAALRLPADLRAPLARLLGRPGSEQTL